MSSNNKTEYVAGSVIYRRYKEAMHLMDPDQVRIFNAKLRQMWNTMIRNVFSPKNRPSSIPWEHKPTAFNIVYTNRRKPREKIVIEPEYDEAHERWTHLVSDVESQADWKDKYHKAYVARKHSVNKMCRAYLDELRSYLLKYADTAFANVGPILPSISEALLGMVTNLKKLDIIEQNNFDSENPSKIEMHPRDIGDLARAERDPIGTVAEEFEQYMLNPDHKVVFNVKGKITIDPVFETIFARYFAARYDVYIIDIIWREHIKMTGIIEEGINAQKQFRSLLLSNLEGTVELAESMNDAITRNITEMSRKLRHFHKNIVENLFYKDIEVVSGLVQEGGVLHMVAGSLETLESKLLELDDIMNSKLSKLDEINSKAQTAAATVTRQINNIEQRLGGKTIKDLLKAIDKIKQYDMETSNGNGELLTNV